MKERYNAETFPSDMMAGQHADHLGLTFDRTWDRRHVARPTVTEVFVTDARQTKADKVIAAAQLPECHGYYNDHIGDPSQLDPILLFEISQQAFLASLSLLDVGDEMSFFPRKIDMSISDRLDYGNHERSGQVLIATSFNGQAGSSGLGFHSCQQTMSLADKSVASLSMSGELVDQPGYQSLRTKDRGEAPPAVQQAKHRPDVDALKPAQVGRSASRNVVLKALEHSAGKLRALIAPPWQNKALISKRYTHLTTHLLLEAARQLAILAIARAGTTNGSRWAIQRISAAIVKFAELDLPVAVSTDRPQIIRGETSLLVTLAQAGQIIARIKLQIVFSEQEPIP